jgi:hypothetical protein
MAQISEKAEKAIKDLLVSWWTAVNNQLVEATAGAVTIGEPDVDDLFESEIGLRMMRIAEAAEGQLEWDPQTAWNILEDCRLFEEWLIQTPLTTKTPEEFWTMPVGFMVLYARLWAEHDRLISASEAAELANISLSSLSQYLSRGKITSYFDPTIANPQHARRIRKSDLPKLGSRTKKGRASDAIYNGRLGTMNINSKATGLTNSLEGNLRGMD